MTLGSNFESPKWEELVGFVSWPELLEWAKAHGAINDRIEKIELHTTKGPDGEMRGVVSMSGFAENENGKSYVIGSDIARWKVTNQMLRWLP